MAVLDQQTSLWLHRVAMIEELGFNSRDASRLANATKTVYLKDKLAVRSYEVAVSWHDVAKLLEMGATPEQVLRILL